VKQIICCLNSISSRVVTDVLWKLNKYSNITEGIDIEGGSKGWTSKSVTALQSALSSHLSSKIWLTLTHNSTVPINTKKLDTETGISLVVNF